MELAFLSNEETDFMGDVFSFFSQVVDRVLEVGWSILQKIEGKNEDLRHEERGWNLLPRDTFTKKDSGLKDLEATVPCKSSETPKIALGDAKVSEYLSGLVSRANLLYGKDEPSFVQEYQDYVEMTAQTFLSQNKTQDLAALQEHLRSPEDYHAKGFLNLPKRADKALGGSQFMEKVLGIDLEKFKTNPRQLGTLSKVERENAILQQIELGNIPDFLRHPTAVILKGPDGGEVKTYVMPDYIAIGSNEDFVRVPLSPIIAQALARKYDLSLPTKTIVEETYAQAGKTVVGPFYTRPEEFEANSAYLDSPGFYLRSDRDIKEQLQGVPLGTLVSGGKKELVVSPHVSVMAPGVPPSEAIDFYGLYGDDGIPIQRTPGHGKESGYRHTEYALGVRFVSPVVVVTTRSGERKVMHMDAALQDREVAKIISRVERTDDQKNIRSTALDGPFDPGTAYRQKPPKGQTLPLGPDAA